MQCAFLLLVACACPLRAHTAGEIAGLVVDGDTGAPVVGANVGIEDLGRWSPTGADGRFHLHSVPTGAQTLRVSHVGYAARRVQVVVAGGRQTETLIELRAHLISLERTLVQSDREATSSASDRQVREFDLRTRPLTTPRQLLQVVPGLTAVRQGGGRAEQIFLRGFDNSFGTDVAVDVDGVPVNLVSHGHGQGYADLHFLIPAVVEAVEVYKGPYFPEYGNLANAAQIAIRTRTHLHGNRLQMRTGSFGSADGTLLYQLPTESARTNAYFAGNVLHTDGPAELDQGLDRLALYSRIHHRLSETSTLDLALTGFASSWREPGLIAGRAVDRGDLSRWGSHNDTQGGSTSRQGLSATYRTHDVDTGRELESTAYVFGYGAELFSDVTFYLLDPIYGDMIEQADSRTVFGLRSRYRFPHRLAGLVATGSAGGGLRADDISLDIWQVVDRRRYWSLLDGEVHERHYYLWGREEIVLYPSLRLVLGLRLDAFHFVLEDRLEGQSGYVVPLLDLLGDLRAAGKVAHVPLVQPHASGVSDDHIASPKLSLIYSPRPGVDLFANAGTGFHSNDARAVVLGQFIRDQSRSLAGRGARPEEIETILGNLNLDPRHSRVSALPRTMGAEIGVRWRVSRTGGMTPRAPLHRLGGGTLGHYPTAGGGLPSLPIRLSDHMNLGAALWWIDVEEEFVYDTDLARPERLGKTRRVGVDVEARLQLLDWLWADADANLARGRLLEEPDNADAIPMAPRFTSSGGLTARGGHGHEASLRWRHLGDRPASPDGELTATGHVLVDVSYAREHGPWRLQLTVGNVLDTCWREAQVPLVTILPGEGYLHIRGPLPDQEVHFTAGAPRQIDLLLGMALD